MDGLEVLSLLIVDRRIGGLEMSREVKKGQHEVDRRIGGLEIDMNVDEARKRS